MIVTGLALFLCVRLGYKGDLDASLLHAGTVSMPLSRKLQYMFV